MGSAHRDIFLNIILLLSDFLNLGVSITTPFPSRFHDQKQYRGKTKYNFPANILNVTQLIHKTPGKNAFGQAFNFDVFPVGKYDSTPQRRCAERIILRADIDCKFGTSDSYGRRILREMAATMPDFIAVCVPLIFGTLRKPAVSPTSNPPGKVSLGMDW